MDTAALGKCNFFEVDQSHGIYYGSDHGRQRSLIVDGIGLKSQDPEHQVLYIVTHGDEFSIDIRLAGEHGHTQHSVGDFMNLARKLGLCNTKYEAVVIAACNAAQDFVPELSELWPADSDTREKPIFLGFDGAIRSVNVPNPQVQITRFDPQIFVKPCICYEGNDVSLKEVLANSSHAKERLGAGPLKRARALLSGQTSMTSEFKVTQLNPTNNSKPEAQVIPVVEQPGRIQQARLTV